MGIRYYAYPVSPREIDAARADPCRFHGEDPLIDAWGPLEERPPMLYLDKCWRCLQALFGLGTSAQRPAAELVRGEVTPVDMGWIPYERVLDPAQVAVIAADLEAVVRDGGVDDPPCTRRGGDYVRQYLKAARVFTAELRDAGYGLVYLIG